MFSRRFRRSSRARVAAETGSIVDPARQGEVRVPDGVRVLNPNRTTAQRPKEVKRGGWDHSGALQ